ESEADSNDIGPQNRMTQLWVELAQAALQSELSDDRARTDPLVVAEAINAHEREQAYDQVIVGYLLKIANELTTAQPAESAALQQRVSQLVRALDPEQLRRLLEMGGDIAQRCRFILDSAQGMSLEAVLTLVRGAAEASHQVISQSLLRLFTKLAAHAEGGAASVRAEAELAL